MIKTRVIVTGLVLILTCTACSSHRDDRRSAHIQAPNILFSPNGEPLSGGPLGPPKCEAALAGWFNRVDVNHDGVIDRQEYLADAKAQFAKMDLDHDGYVTAAKLSVFRAPYEEAGPIPAVAEADNPPPDRPAEADGQHHHGRGPSAPPTGAPPPLPPMRGPPPPMEDPVMSADRTLSFKVSLEDFLAHAEGVFAQLDSARSGRLPLMKVQSRCPADKEPE